MTFHLANAGLNNGPECANTFTANPVTQWVDFFLSYVLRLTANQCQAHHMTNCSYCVCNTLFSAVDVSQEACKS
jgi:hypothetical protein